MICRVEFHRFGSNDTNSIFLTLADKISGEVRVVLKKKKKYDAINKLS